MSSADASHAGPGDSAPRAQGARATALEQWHLELATGTRTLEKWDTLYWAAFKELQDADFERMYLAPQRRYVAELRARHAGRPVPQRSRQARSPHTAGVRDYRTLPAFGGFRGPTP